MRDDVQRNAAGGGRSRGGGTYAVGGQTEEERGRVKSKMNGKRLGNPEIETKKKEKKKGKERKSVMSEIHWKSVE